MTINIQKFNEVAEAAKARTSDKRWQNAIDKAVAGVTSGWWVITELHDGVYAQAFARLKATRFELRWQSRADDRERQKKAASKTKYTCPNCEQNAWAKPDSSLICGVCLDEDGSIDAMEATGLESA
jgi:hypothetical protein